MDEVSHAAPDRDPPAAVEQDRGGWLPVLVVVAVALGLAMSWAVHERRTRAQLASRLQGIAKDAALVEAKARELSQFLLDPHTRLIHLRGTGRASDRTATVAWNASRGEGVVLVEADGTTTLRLLAEHPGASPIQLLQFRPAAPGGHAFRYPGPIEGGPITFSIESAPAAADAAPSGRAEVLRYEEVAPGEPVAPRRT